MFLGKSNVFLTILNFCHASSEISTVSVPNYAGSVNGSVRIFTILVHVSKLRERDGERDGSVMEGNAKLDRFLVPRRFIFGFLTVARW